MSVARPIPVFRPTTEEFSDFAKYVTSIQPIAEQFGIAKVIPPEGWRARVSSYEDLQIEIPCPIRQFVHGKQGVYQVVNVMEKPMSLAQFKQAADDQFAKCFPKSKREGSDPEKFDMEELERRFWKNLTFHAPLYGADMLGSLFEDDPAALGDQDQDDAKNGGSGGDDGAADAASASDDIDVETVDDADPAQPSETKAGSKKNRKSPASSPNKRKRGAETAAEAGKGEEGPRHHAWNLGHLDTLLSQRLGKLLPGVTSPYLYFGMWKSLFACHTEDMDLYSINYLHFGKPKVWYGVPSAQKHRVEQVAQLHFPMQFKECPEFLRHKSAIFSPNILKTGNVSLTHAVQQPGEFIITFPGAYHFGFNSGFNCAEAVNFALERWLHFGKKAKPCKCVADSVRIDVGLFISMVANGEEVPADIIPSPTKKAKTQASTKKQPTKGKNSKRATKKTKKAGASEPSSDSPVRTVMGARSMGMVTSRMTQIPEPPVFVEETLADDDAVPVLSDDELRSGDEGDGGEYLEGRKKNNKKKAAKPRSTRSENKRAGTSSQTSAADKKRDTKKRKQQTTGNKRAAAATNSETADASTPTKRTARRRNAGTTTQTAPKQNEAPQTNAVVAPPSTREFQGFKIIIRPPKAESSIETAHTAQTPTVSVSTAEKRPKRSRASKRTTRQGTKAAPLAPKPEGKTTARGQLNAEANRLLAHRDERTTTRVEIAPEPSYAMPPQPSTPSNHVPWNMSDVAQLYRTSAYGHLLLPSVSEHKSSSDVASSEGSPTLMLQRQKLKELRERQQQLQQHRQEQQQHLQQLNEYIQAQRQLYHQIQPAMPIPGAPSVYGLPSPLPYVAGSSFPSSSASLSTARSLPTAAPFAPILTAAPQLPSLLPTPQLYPSPALPVPPYYVDRSTRTASPEGGKSKLVPILPSPSPFAYQPHPPPVAASTPLPPSSLTPTTHPVSS